MSSPAVRPRYQRDRFTFTVYGGFAVWGWVLYTFNPAMPLIAEEFNISRAQAGLHGTAIAVGSVVTATFAPRLIAARGRRFALLLAATLLVIGVGGLVTGHVLWWTMTAMFIASLGGNLTVSAALTALAAHHGPTASAALTEANGVGSGVGLLGPLAVGGTIALGWGWRPAVAVAGLIALATLLATRALPDTPALGRPPLRPAGTVAAPTATATWCFLGSIIAAIALENATTFWSADLVKAQTGAGDSIGLAATAGLVAGMTLIRFIAGPLSLRLAPARLLFASFLIAIVGWAILWTASDAGIAVAGLFIAGLGYGVQYPLAVALILAADPLSADRSQGRITLAAGIAVGAAPFVLGALADATSSHTAFLIVPVVALAGAVLAETGRRLMRAPVTVAMVRDVAADEDGLGDEAGRDDQR